MGTEKPNMAASLRKIHSIFLAEWDPIGIGNLPEAVDEYDLYLMPVYQMLREQRSAEAITGYLQWVEVERMGLGPPQERLKKVTQMLLDIDVSGDEILQ
jgi:hypothetical protein